MHFPASNGLNIRLDDLSFFCDGGMISESKWNKSKRGEIYDFDDVHMAINFLCNFHTLQIMKYEKE